MKNTLLVLYLFLTLSLSAQAQNCQFAQTGKFELKHDTSPAITIIERTKTKQFEYVEYYGLEMSYDVVWLDSCTYELRNRKLIKGPENFRIDPKNYTTVKILEVNEPNVLIEATTISGFKGQITIRKIE